MSTALVGAVLLAFAGRSAGLGRALHKYPPPPPPRPYNNRKRFLWTSFIVQELCESRGGRPGLFRPNEPSGFRGRKELLNRASALVTTCP